MDSSKSICYWVKKDGECRIAGCRYVHSWDDVRICRRWREGTCPHVVDCFNRHYFTDEELETLDIRLCRKWQLGQCLFPSDCAFRHYYTEEDEQVMESKRFIGPKEVPTSKLTAPIHVKVYKETRELRQELYDLGTGEWRTWTEKEEYEVVDLTEDTPVKLVGSPSTTAELDLTSEEDRRPLAHVENLIEKVKRMRMKSFGSCKSSNSTSNLSVIDGVDYSRFQLKSSSSPIFPRIRLEEESHDASHASSTFGLLSENANMASDLSTSIHGPSCSCSMFPIELDMVCARGTGTPAAAPRSRANSLRI